MPAKADYWCQAPLPPPLLLLLHPAAMPSSNL
jgi:hypothetical protein